jgi:hypothetical protein
MRYLHEQFKLILPQIEADLVGLGGHLPKLFEQHRKFVASKGANCIYARATLKLIFVEALHRDRERFELSLRNRGYAG